MPQPRLNGADGLSTPLVVLGSVALVAHLAAVVAAALAAPSGPWPTADGPPGVAPPPEFALAANATATPDYLRWVKLAHDFRFPSDQPGAPGVRFEVRLRDAAGTVTETLKFPETSANPWVRYRQELLAQHLAPDVPVQPLEGEAIPAPNQKVKTVQIWDMSPDKQLRLRSVPEHLVPRDHPVFRPSDWALVLVKSYCRYLCREHGAASAEFVRYTRNPIPPVAVAKGPPPPQAFEELVANFGVHNGE